TTSNATLVPPAFSHPAQPCDAPSLLAIGCFNRYDHHPTVVVVVDRPCFVFPFVDGRPVLLLAFIRDELALVLSSITCPRGLSIRGCQIASAALDAVPTWKAGKAGVLLVDATGTASPFLGIRTTPAGRAAALGIISPAHYLQKLKTTKTNLIRTCHGLNPPAKNAHLIPRPAEDLNGLIRTTEGEKQHGWLERCSSSLLSTAAGVYVLRQWLLVKIGMRTSLSLSKSRTAC
ncbi:hypothetical protein BDZ89DRAFT_1058993, partial [Hymenopellis radicata]